MMKWSYRQGSMYAQVPLVSYMLLCCCCGMMRPPAAFQLAGHGPERRHYGASHDHEDLWASEGNSWRASEAQPQD